MLSREELLKEIHEASFAVNDITLYLDTHPTDTQALKFFQTCMQKRKSAMKEYETQFEPLIIDCVDPANNNLSNFKTKYAGSDHWTWVDGPAPWEGGCA